MCRDTAAKLLTRLADDIRTATLTETVAITARAVPEVLRQLQHFHPKAHEELSTFHALIGGMNAGAGPFDPPRRFAEMLAQQVTMIQHVLKGTAQAYLEVEERLQKHLKNQSRMAAVARVSGSSSADFAPHWQQEVRMPPRQEQTLLSFLRERFRGEQLPNGTCWCCKYVSPDGPMALPVNHSCGNCPRMPEAEMKRSRETRR